ncbi:MAG: M20/M25/M40 family metallo-hydrolase, partial [Microbacteriaceae bacterium]|nr:M20/M25/M40 family metallo-hydrolase [Microbacteriaceae bacterium]
DRMLAEQLALTAIAAPPFKEAARAAHFRDLLAQAGLGDAHVDAEGNVIAVRKGTGNGGPVLVLSAHLDSVFPQETDLTITQKDGRYYAPGIRDDTRGLAAVLSVARAFAETGLRTVADVWFVGTVGEEGLGNLRGVRALFREHPRIDGFISIDGGDMGRVTLGATGSRRFRVTYTGPGGHSFGAFGIPSAAHAMGRAIAKIADLRTPTDPKTTFNVGRVRGGTGATAIAEEAQMDVDVRSNSAEELERTAAQVLAMIEASAKEENARWQSDALSVKVEDLGMRPAGHQDNEIPIVRSAVAAVQSLGVESIQYGYSSTDCNIPISLGIPAIAIPGGGKSGGNHSLGEWFDPTLGHLGPQNAFLTVL